MSKIGDLLDEINISNVVDNLAEDLARYLRQFPIKDGEEIGFIQVAITILEMLGGDNGFSHSGQHHIDESIEEYKSALANITKER